MVRIKENCWVGYYPFGKKKEERKEKQFPVAFALTFQHVAPACCSEAWLFSFIRLFIHSTISPSIHLFIPQTPEYHQCTNYWTLKMQVSMCFQNFSPVSKPHSLVHGPYTGTCFYLVSSTHIEPDFCCTHRKIEHPFFWFWERGTTVEKYSWSSRIKKGWDPHPEPHWLSSAGCLHSNWP